MEFKVDENVIYEVGVYHKGVKACFTVKGAKCDKRNDRLELGSMNSRLDIEGFSKCAIKETDIEDEYDITLEDGTKITLTQL